MDQQKVQQPLIDVATSIVQLEEALYDTDYNRALRFTRRDALDLADLAEQAFQDWQQVRGSLPSDAFLAGLLVYRHMQG